MPQTLSKPVLLDETGQSIAEKLDNIKDAIETAGEFTPLLIKVTNPPVKTSYNIGELLDLTGIVVSLVAANGATINVTEACTFVPSAGTALTVNDNSISISYYWYRDDVTFTTEYPIGVKDLSSITVTSAPSKLSYKVGESLDLTGMVVMATYSDSTSLDVTSRCTTSPVNGAILTLSDTEVIVSYTEGSLTKTATQVIAVKEVSAISITNPPTQTTYDSGDSLDLTGIEVTATYTDGSTADVTSLCTYSPANGATLSTSNTSVTVTFLESGLTKTATQSITVEYPIYGAEWDGTATTAWTRTDAAANFVDPVPAVYNHQSGLVNDGSSPFDNIYPWSAMNEVVNADLGTVVTIPKFYYKLTQDGSKLKIQITQDAKEGYHVSPAHMSRNLGSISEFDVVYVGKYISNDTNHKSLTNKSFDKNIDRGSAREYAKSFSINSGDSKRYVYLLDFATLFTIWLLYLVEFADWNSQSKLGNNFLNNSSMVTGYTDSISYHTGKYIYSSLDYSKYRNIENLWATAQWIDACYFDTQKKFGVSLNFTQNGNWDYGYGGTLVSDTAFSSGYPSALSIVEPTGLFPIFIPTAFSGSDSTYICDYFSTTANPCISNGGKYYSETSEMQGLFRINDASGSGKSQYVTYRLLVLPQNAL